MLFRSKLDRRHRQDFGDNPIDNLKQIQENGIEVFLEKEREKWKCTRCSAIVCVNTNKCYNCSRETVKSKN